MNQKLPSLLSRTPATVVPMPENSVCCSAWSLISSSTLESSWAISSGPLRRGPISAMRCTACSEAISPAA